VLLLLLHFSIAISRLSGETKVLAQVVARLDQELRAVRGEADGALEAPVASQLPQPEPRRDPAARR
jgi:hypothetical protein